MVQMKIILNQQDLYLETQYPGDKYKFNQIIILMQIYKNKVHHRLLIKFEKTLQWI